MPAELAIFNPTVLNGLIEKFNRPENLLGLSQIFGGDRVVPSPDPTIVYDVITAARDKTVPNVPNTEAHVVKQLGMGQVVASMIYLRDKKTFSATTIRWTRVPGTLGQKNAEAHVLREVRHLSDRFDKFAEFCIWEILTTGTLVFTGGNVIISVDFQFPSANKPTAGTAWTSAGADIIGNVQAWKRVVSRNGQVNITDAYLNSVAMAYLLKNTEIRGLLTEEKKNEFLNTGTVIGLLGIDWHEYDIAYVDDNGTTVQYIDDNTIVFLSNENSDRWFFFEGPSADHDAPEGHIGRFAKSWLQPDPSARFHLLEYMFFPAIFRPEQIIIATIGP